MNSQDQSNDHKSIVLPFPSSNLLYILFNLFYLKRYKRGIYHITGHVHYAVLALPQASTILTIHDLVFLKTYRGLKKRIMKWLFLDLPVRRVKWITTVSEKTKQEIIQYTNCKPDKIIVIDNPVDPNLLCSEKIFCNTKPTLLFLGTTPNKNLENCIPAIFNLNVKLRIIGEISQRQEEFLYKFKIDFTVVKQISDAELRYEYECCDLVLFPSLYEGFGLPVIEAFAVGKPIITSDIPPLNTIAKDAAILVNPHSISSIRKGVQMLVSNSDLRKEKTSKGFQLVKAYQAKKVMARYQQLWENVDKVNAKVI